MSLSSRGEQPEADARSRCRAAVAFGIRRLEQAVELPLGFGRVVSEAELQLGVVQPVVAKLTLGQVVAGLEKPCRDPELRRQLAQGLDRGGALATFDLRDVLRRYAGRGDVALG